MIKEGLLSAYSDQKKVFWLLAVFLFFSSIHIVNRSFDLKGNIEDAIIAEPAGEETNAQNLASILFLQQRTFHDVSVNYGTLSIFWPIIFVFMSFLILFVVKKNNKTLLIYTQLSSTEDIEVLFCQIDSIFLSLKIRTYYMHGILVVAIPALAMMINSFAGYFLYMVVDDYAGGLGGDGGSLYMISYIFVAQCILSLFAIAITAYMGVKAVKIIMTTQQVLDEKVNGK